MYDFRETTPFKGSDDNQRPAEAMLIDGQYIEDLIPGYSTLQVSGRELLSQSIEKQTIGKSDGEFIQYVRNPSREIVVGYRLAAADNLSFRQAFYKLNSILHGDSHQVSFNDDPSKYWIATFSDIDDVPKGRNAITSSFTLFVPDGIAHSVATQTADNMPYKDMPMNFVIASHASGSNTTSPDVYPIHMQLSEDLSGQTITTVAKVVVTNYQGKINNSNSQSYIDVKDGNYTWDWWGLINQINVTGNGVYTSAPRTRTKAALLRGTDNHIDVEMYNLNATIEVWIKLEKGNTATDWSPNPADPEYYTNTITVHNGGTYPVEPVITATMHADNGLIALINGQGGVLQFGNPEE
ncbi:distal tail protein Dit, partial [Lacticaseibacillus paracasei]|uniref:distal tail protein Dit n=1 Tax=Lacticaseibacillus paracasei TaxID=1597 RepID=UPI001899B47A